MSYGALGSTGFGAAGGPAWYQVWSAGNQWAGWLWADAAAAQRVANDYRAVIRTASGQLVPKKYKKPAYCNTSAGFVTDGDGIERIRPECLD